MIRGTMVTGLTAADRLRIWRRDRWQCRMPECLCPDGRGMNPDLAGTFDWWAPTVDHIRRRVDGGDDRDGNLRSAHRKCNNDDPGRDLRSGDDRWPTQAPQQAVGLDIASRIDAGLAARLRAAAADVGGAWRPVREGLAGREYPEHGPYRYLLGRSWGEGPVMCLCMLNPSTATWKSNDATVVRCCWFARAAGCGSLVIVNLFGLRSRHPRVLLEHPDPVGPGNDEIITREAQAADLVVAAWGANGALPKLAPRRLEVTALLAGLPLYCLGTTNGGDPRHPLMLPKTTPLIPWEALAGKEAGDGG
jgi:hypothetical protein